MTTSSTLDEIVAVPLGGLDEAAIRLGFGGGELSVGVAEPGMLLSGTFEGGVLRRSTAPGTIELEPLTPGRPLVTWRPVRWDVGVTTEIPVTLRLDTGANRSSVDLSALRIPRLELHTGASETTLRLPAAGRTSVLVACGFASVTLEVPDGVAARIHGKMVLGATSVDEGRFPRTLDRWESPDYDAAADRVEIAIEGGFGSVAVR